MKKITAVTVILLLTAAVVFAGGAKDTASSGGTQKVTVELFDRGTDGGRTQVDNNAWTNWIKDKVRKDLNIDVNFFPVGRWDEEQTLITLMAAGNAPDLCYTYNTGNVSGFRDQGGLLDFSPYIDKFLPDMKKLLGADPALSGKEFIYRNQMPDGKIFNIPSYRVALAQRNVFIRKDWLDKLGIALPKNIKDFHDALAAFRDNDPGNVGKNNVIPLMTDRDTRWKLANFIHSSIDPNLSDKDRYIYNIADRSFAMPGYKEGVRMMNQWFNEGLIFRDFPLVGNDSDDFYNTVKSGAVGAFCGNWDLPYRNDYSIMKDLRSNVPNADFVPVDAFQNKEMYDKVGLQIIIPSFSKNQEAALKYLNWLCIGENYSFLQIGQEGVNHRMVDGVPEIIARPPNDPWFQNSGSNIDFTMPMNGIEMGNDELNARVLALTYAGTAPEAIVNAYSIGTVNARAPVVVNSPTTQDGIYGQTLRDGVEALLGQSITAKTADFDRVWDTGFQNLMQSGGQAIMDERKSIANSVWK